MNKDGTENDGAGGHESGIAGAGIELLDLHGNVVQVAHTNHKGEYQFDVPDGTYRVKFPAQEGRHFTHKDVGNDAKDSDVNAHGVTDPIEIWPGKTMMDVDAGVKPGAPGSIKGRYFVDADKDGLEDATDPGLAGKLIQLRDANTGAIVATTHTDDDGNYSFDNVPNGAYCVVFEQEHGGHPTHFQVGHNTAIDSDLKGNWESHVFNVGAGEDVCDVDAGVKTNKPGWIKGRIFDDLDCDGQEEAGEPGFGHIWVALVNTANNKIVTWTKTDADGNYQFDLPAGDYKVLVRIDSLADDYKLTDANVGPEATDSDGVSLHDHGLNSNGHRVAEVYTEEFHVNPGQTVMDIDVGLKNEAPGSISGTVFCDIDCDGIQDKEIIGGEGFDKKSGYIITNGVPGGLKAVELHSGRKAGATLEATEIGPDATFSAWARFDTTHNNYQRIFDFSNGATHDNILLTQVGRTDDMMFEVYDSSNGHNVKLIVRDVIKVGEWANWTVTDNLKITATVAETSIAEEPGKDGVTVMLLNADGTPVLDADGNPITTVTDADGDYSFDGVLAGDYRVKVTAPDGFAFTDQNVGSDDTVDSDVNDAGVSDVISVGEDVTDVDAGLKDKPAPLPGSLSGTYFCDEDRDGTDSAGDTDVAGKTVMLFLADGVTPATDIDGNPVANAVTDANGDYSFTNLAAGDYVVMFEATDGKSFIAANQGSDADDSDVVDLANGKTAPVTVVAGQTTENVDAGVATDNQAPVATDDAGEGCAEDDIVVDLSDNYSDADSASVSISSIGGVAIADGQTVTIDGVNITLSGDSFIFDGEMELSDLDIGESETRSYDYHVVDSDGATATASIDVKFCGDANTASSLLDTFDFFGEYQVRAGNQPDPLNPDPSAIDIKLSGIGVDARLDGQVFDAYCLSFFDPAGSSADFDTAPFQTANVFSAESAQVNNVFEPGQVGSFNNQSAADNLDLIKWIVAQDYEGQGFTGWEVQFAIWELTDINKTNDDGSPFDPRALLDAFPTYGESDNLDFILAEAAANGEGFDFDLNGHVGLIVDPDPVTDTNSQPFIIAFDPEDYDCIC